MEVTAVRKPLKVFTAAYCSKKIPAPFDFHHSTQERKTEASKEMKLFFKRLAPFRRAWKSGVIYYVSKLMNTSDTTNK